MPSGLSIDQPSCRLWPVSAPTPETGGAISGPTWTSAMSGTRTRRERSSNSLEPTVESQQTNDRKFTKSCWSGSYPTMRAFDSMRSPSWASTRSPRQCQPSDRSKIGWKRSHAPALPTSGPRSTASSGGLQPRMPDRSQRAEPGRVPVGEIRLASAGTRPASTRVCDPGHPARRRTRRRPLRSRRYALVVDEWVRVRSSLEARGIAGSDDFGRFVNDTKHFRPSVFDERAAMPVLVEVLPTVTDKRVVASIARHLRRPWARPAAFPALQDAFGEWASKD